MPPRRAVELNDVQRFGPCVGEDVSQPHRRGVLAGGCFVRRSIGHLRGLEPPVCGFEPAQRDEQHA